jgi:hypothetical protein
MPADCVAQLMGQGYSRAEAEATCSEAGQRKSVAAKAMKAVPKRRDDSKMTANERKRYGISDETYGKAQESLRKKREGKY